MVILSPMRGFRWKLAHPETGRGLVAKQDSIREIFTSLTLNPKPVKGLIRALWIITWVPDNSYVG